MLPEDLQARYLPIELLGEGGFGKVVAARDRELGRQVAIKLLHVALADEEAIGRFRREAKVTAGIRHPHVVALLDSGILSDGTPYLVYECVEGRDYACEPPDPVELPDIAVAIAGAMACAHATGVVHRDVKPANVLRRGPGDPVLADFGIARVDRGGTQYTADGLILGTPIFMAPELYLGELPSPASDQFAWAASLVAMSGGGSVYGTEDVAEILARLRRPVQLRLDAETRRTLGALAPVVEKALAADPGQRHPDCASFAERLRSPPAAPPGATVRLPEDHRVQDSRMALPAASSRAPTTRKLLVGDGSVHALALRGVLAAGVAGLLGWALWWGPRPRARALPPTPTLERRSDEFSKARVDLDAAARALRSLVPPREPGDIRRPSFEEQVEAYPRLTEPKTHLLWNRWLRSLEVWLRSVPPEELRRQPVLDQLLNDGVRLGDLLLAYLNEIKYNLQQGSSRFGTLADLKTYTPRKAHPSWDIAAWNTVWQDFILSTEESLCRFDGMLLDEKPAGALLLGVLVSQLQLVSPSLYMSDDDPCQETTRRRLVLYLQLLHIEVLGSQELTSARPWLRGLARLLARVSDSGLLPPEDRITYLEELVAHVDLLEDAAPPEVLEECWRRLLVEVWRAPYRDPSYPRGRALALLDQVYPRYREVAAVSQEGARDLLDAVQNLSVQNYTSEIPELMARLPELEALVAGVERSDR